jgi:hypothetical protein
MAGMAGRALVLVLLAAALPGAARSAEPAAGPLARVAVVIDAAPTSGSRHAAAMAVEGASRDRSTGARRDLVR